ncbi:MAG: Gfo/Idh/MocA family oxidoreductase [Acidobacteriia bacterium]|nr:Gfo/Idh/MocA family oxidoreductase [Terriglobia bacterium]
MAYIGCGTEGLLELMAMLTVPEIQVVAVCDPVKFGDNYKDFGSDRVTAGIRRFLGKPDWRAGQTGIAAGRDVAKEVIESYYAQFRSGERFRGVSAYADFRELLEKEKDVNAVKIMTPDHMHATIALAAMKKGKHTVVHKPIANRMEEAQMVFDTTRKTGVATYFMPWRGGNMDQVAQWIRDGAIGTLREIHNWTEAAGSRRFRLGPLAWSGARSPLPSQLHAHGFPRLVRFWGRLYGRHGALQPMSRVLEFETAGSRQRYSECIHPVGGHEQHRGAAAE